MNTRKISLCTRSGEIPIHFAMEGMGWVSREIVRLLGQERPRVCVIADERVMLLYGAELISQCERAGLDATSLSFPPGEAGKNLRTAERLLDAMVDAKFARDDLVVGIGGGVSTDIAGFVAALLQRGMRWIAVPTTVMGMADAAIGGKTGVDHVLGKNLIGAFHQPRAILAPLAALRTLPAREWVSGSAEVVKSALISGGDFWRRLAADGINMQSWGATEQAWAIGAAAQVKADIVSQDEHESGLRRVLNLGHSFAHAVETVTNYRRYRHGEAVILGLRAAVRISHRHGLLAAAVAEEIDDMLARVPVPGGLLAPETLLEALTRDKKVASGRLRWVLLRQPGQAVIAADVPAWLVRETAEWISEIATDGIALDDDDAIPRVLVLNGPNLNLLGEREPDLYGRESLNELERFCVEQGNARGIEVICRQTNVEGELVNVIQMARRWARGIIINPGGYTHTSVAIRDALTAVRLPVIEVHLSDISQREEFRRHSLIGDVCLASMVGKGKTGYAEALEFLASRWKDKAL